jgi:hypothetical protein
VKSAWLLASLQRALVTPRRFLQPFLGFLNALATPIKGPSQRFIPSSLPVMISMNPSPMKSAPSSDLASQYHFPAIDVLRSISRVLTQITTPAHVKLIGKIREVLSNYKKNELLIRIGEYKPGSDKNADFAIKYIDKVNRFLKQQVEETCTLEETLRQLEALFN